MNKDQAAKMLPIIKQIAEGKTIQKRIGGEWVSLAYVEFFIDADNYRIKPEPKMAWYRVAELNGVDWIVPNATAFSESTEENLALRPYFKRWLTERITYEVTE